MYIWPHVNGIFASDNNTIMCIPYGPRDYSEPFTNCGLVSELAAVFSFFSGGYPPILLCTMEDICISS